MKNLTFLVILFCPYVGAEMRSQQALSFKKTTTSFVAELKPGFHFNEKAPNAVVSTAGTIKPNLITASKIAFEYDKAPPKAKAQLYVCDDAITFCETHSISLGKGQGKDSAVSQLKNSALPQKTKGKVDHHGFIQDDLTSALSLAKAQNKLVMIDFSAAWCPSCRRLEQEVFSTKAFAQYQKNFVFVKLDTDRFQNSAIAEKYKIIGIPTLVFITPDQSVLAQILDYQPLERFEKLLSSVTQNPTPITAQIDQISTLSEDEKQTLGLRFYYAGNYADANRVWLSMKTPPKELANSQYLEGAEKFEKETLPEKEFRTLLEALLKREGNTGRSLAWRKSLLELKEFSTEERTRIFSEGITLADSILAKPGSAKTSLDGDLVSDLEGYEDFVIANYRADLFEANNSTDIEKQSAWEKAVSIGEKSHFNPKEIGPALRFLSVMAQAKAWDKGHLWILKLKKANPGYADLLRREVRFLVELKKFPEAVKIGEQALAKSYDRNHFWVVEYLAKAYMGTGQNQKAQALVQSYLLKPEIDVKALTSTKKALTKLQDQIKTTDLR